MNGITSVSNNYPSYGDFASGKKINTAADGAAELSIIQRQEKDVNGYDAGANNMHSGKEALNVSDGALGQITDSLQRMKELAIQAKNGTYSDTERRMIQDEVEQLKQGIANITSQTDYNGKKLLDGSSQEFDMVTDAKGTTMEVTTVSSTLEQLGIADFDVTQSFDLGKIDEAIETISSARGSMGAQSNGFEYALNYNAGASYNLTSSVSRLEDLDIPQAISDKKKQQTLQEYALAMQKKAQEQKQQHMKNFFTNM